MLANWLTLPLDDIAGNASDLDMSVIPGSGTAAARIVRSTATDGTAAITVARVFENADIGLLVDVTCPASIDVDAQAQSFRDAGLIQMVVVPN